MSVTMQLIIFVGLLMLWLIWDEFKLYKLEKRCNELRMERKELSKNFIEYKKYVNKKLSENDSRIHNVENIIEVITDERTSPTYSG